MATSSRRVAAPTFADLRPGTLRGAAGFFRVGRGEHGPWWLVTPEDELVLLRAVAGVNRHGRAGPPPTLRGAYARAVDHLYGPASGTGQDWARSTATRLHTWGVDTVGPWADAGLADRGFYFTALADFARMPEFPVLHGPGLRLPDVFDPRWPAAAEAHAAAVAGPWAGRPELVGWFTDDALGWGSAEPARPGLFQICLSLEPAHAAHHAAWEFALANNGGNLEAAARRWEVDLGHREHLRQLTREDRGLAGAAFADDAARFAREFARRYFATTARALRAADPLHLVLGCRFAHPPPAAVRAACAAPDVDVVSWRLRAGASFAAQAVACAGDSPQWVTGGGLSHGDFKKLPLRDGTGPTRLERLLRAGREGLVAACRDPRTVGIEWAHWADGGDEAPPFGAGLVHADDDEAVEHTELLTHIHLRARALHAGGAPGCLG